MRALFRLCLSMMVCLGASLAAAPQFLVYFGTYTGPKSKGVYVSRFDARTGKLEPIRLAGEVIRPSWVTLHPNGRVLYAVSELADGAISSFAIDLSSGELKLLNKVSSGGGGTCHLAVDKAGKTVYAANYGTGSVAAFPLEARSENPTSELQSHFNLLCRLLLEK